jgi:hypothetical protein
VGLGRPARCPSGKGSRRRIFAEPPPDQASRLNSIEQQREQLKGKYCSPKWAKRVDNMPDSQVTAILMRLRRQYKNKI